MGVQDSLNEIVKELNLDDDIRELLSFKFVPPMNSRSELLDLAKRIGLDLELKESKGSVDLVRRSTALSSNVIPLDVDDPVEVLWRVAQHFKGDLNWK